MANAVDIIETSGYKYPYYLAKELHAKFPGIIRYRQRPRYGQGIWFRGNREISEHDVIEWVKRTNPNAKQYLHDPRYIDHLIKELRAFYWVPK